MGKFLVNIGTVQLAVFLGLGEFIVVEILKFVTQQVCTGIHRSSLYRNGCCKYRSPKSTLLSVTNVLVVVQCLLLFLCVWSEMSISTAFFPSNSLTSLSCYHPSHLSLAIQKGGPSKSELLDDRISEYILQSACDGSMLSSALSGTDIRKGYPPCLLPFEPRDINITLRLQGSAMAQLRKKNDIDPFLTYGLSENGKIMGEDLGEALAPTSFWALDNSESNKSSPVWFENSTGIITNVALPRKITEDLPAAFNEDSTATVVCDANNLECYRKSARVAHKAPLPIYRSYMQRNLTTMISTQRFLPSDICLFTNTLVRIEISWVQLNQTINGLKWAGRRGPVANEIHISGLARCIRNVSRESSRLYLDAMEHVDILEAMKNVREGTNFSRMSMLLQKAAIVLGKNVPVNQSVECQAFKAIEGSSIGATAMYASCSILAIILVIIIGETIWLFRERWRCPIKYDPFDRVTLLNELHRRDEYQRNERSSVPVESRLQPSNASVTFRAIGSLLSKRVSSGNSRSNSNRIPPPTQTENNSNAFSVYLDKESGRYELRLTNNQDNV